jgi:hypothetical protein
MLDLQRFSSFFVVSGVDQKTGVRVGGMVQDMVEIA